MATVDDDIILPCHLEPAVDVSAKTLGWTRLDLKPRFVHVQHDDQDLVGVKNPAYKGRTSLFTGEPKRGNISLKISPVKPSDEGRYKCSIPEMHVDSFVELVVGKWTHRLVPFGAVCTVLCRFYMMNFDCDHGFKMFPSVQHQVLFLHLS